MSAPLVVIRCDGGAALGAGHVARCVPIADALRRRGARVVFAGTYDGVAAELLHEHETTAPDPAVPAGIPAGATAAIVDSYAIADAELAAADAVQPVLAVIDDGRRPDVRLVLAYALGAAPGDGVLAGPAYAPVDPRVVAARVPARDTGRALVALGGGTTGAELLGPIVDALIAGTPYDVVVAGASAVPEHSRVEALGPVPRLATTFGAYDLAVTGAGFMKVETACAGLPVVFVVVADNQAPSAGTFAELGLGVLLDGRDGLTRADVETALAAVGPNDDGPRLVDGLGAMRIADALLEATPPPIVTLRPATSGDTVQLLAWRNDPEVRAVSTTTHAIAPDAHAAWLAGVLADPDRELLVAEHDGAPLGTVRFDRADGEAEISVSVDASRRGTGLGTALLRAATELQLAARPDLRAIVARVRADNARSRRAFEAAGYASSGVSDDWLTLRAAR